MSFCRKCIHCKVKKFKRIPPRLFLQRRLNIAQWRALFWAKYDPLNRSSSNGS